MTRTASRVSHVSARCLRPNSQYHVSTRAGFQQRRAFTCSFGCLSRTVDQAAQSTATTEPLDRNVPSTVPRSDDQREAGAMSRRLANATEDVLIEGGRAGRKAIEEAGFSEELKEKLLEKMKAQNFQSENASAVADAGLTSRAGRGTRDVATAQAWTGTESTEDAVLRMLSDAHKPLKPGLRGGPNAKPVVDLRIRREPKRSPGQRLANARDKTSIYAISKDIQMSEKERESMKEELKERFRPENRAMPTTFQGLAALANERIEDAIARGQFKNIPRGKAIERDARADNPFIDTTEYIMNKMIQRQEIVPPWIEKQQELVRAVNVFRGRLRNDWKRHAARTIASKGGTLHEQVRAAEEYAESERLNNPRKRTVEQMSVPTTVSGDPFTVTITEDMSPKQDVDAPTRVVQVALETKEGETAVIHPVQLSASTSIIDTVPSADTTNSEAQTASTRSLPAPFRDPAWERAEMSYLNLAITNLNNLTRSYNLMAPDLAKKPYFSLNRELLTCYADVAPQLGRVIVERAARPSKESVEKVGHRPGSVLERLSGETANVYDSEKPMYGLKEFWSDLWGGKENRL